MSQDLFTTSLIPWFRDRPDEVIRNILEATYSRDPGVGTEIFRPAEVFDAAARRVIPTTLERLIRWDDRHPDDVFWNGFVSWAPGTGDLAHSYYDLGAYVGNNERSIFVGTARYYRNENNQLRVWQPRAFHQFEYEIFAYGGIDVDNTLRSINIYANQHEVAFPGGIRREFIRSAREYVRTASGRRLLRIWDNPRFRPEANPAGHAQPYQEYPQIIRGVQVPVIFFTPRDGASHPDNPPPGAPPHDPYEHEHDELRRRRRDTEQDVMHTEGEGLPDDVVEKLVVDTCRGRACVLHPSDSGRAYFFFANEYVAINTKPGTTTDTIAWGPKYIVDNWPSLVDAKFGNVDAILPHPEDPQKMYFFCLDQYALINIKPGTTNDFVINGPESISTEWPSLHQAGFKKIDAILPHPEDKHEAYFFSGTQYALIKIEPGTTNDYIIGGPKSIQENWPSLVKSGFTTVDAILPNPSNSDEAYFFSGDKYSLINVKPGTTNDYVVNGPKLIRTEWPSLHLAGFW